MYDCCVQTFGITLTKEFVPSGTVQANEVLEAQTTLHQVADKSLYVHIFVLVHSTSNHLSVVFGIATQFASVSKYFTQSTFAPWKGEERTFVDTYSQGVFTL